MTVAAPPSNFSFLQAHDEQLVRLGFLAEQYFADDPNTCLIKLRQYGEVLAQRLTAQQAAPAGKPPIVKVGYVAAGSRAAAHVGFHTAEDRKLIYDQLRQAGSHANSVTLRYGAGTRPQRGRTSSSQSGRR